MLRLLHLTNWYPEPAAPERTPFIAEHVLALAPFVQQQLWHVEVQPSRRGWRLEWAHRPTGERALLLQCPLASGQLQELLTLLLLLLLRLRLIRGHWDLVVVHIAWPLLRFPRLVRLLFGRRVLLIEHWSAYHSRFQLPAGSSALRRLQGMFATGIPVVAVSEALADDLRGFSGRPDLPLTVVPNAVDTSLFRPGVAVASDGTDSLAQQPRHRWLMVASWAPIKRPLLVLQAISQLVAEAPSLGQQLRLRIVGGGEQVEAMAAFIAAHQLQDVVQLLGPQPKSVIASQLRQATVFLHPSAYETFSVVCAEALCSGLPVVASAVGALPELITPANGVLVANTPQSWTGALGQLLRDPPAWDQQAIARQAASRFSRPMVGRQLLAVVQRLAARR